MKGGIAGNIEEFSFQSVDSFLRRSHGATYRGWLAHKTEEKTIKERDSHDRLHFPYMYAPMDRDETGSHMTNCNVWERAMCSVASLRLLGVAPAPNFHSNLHVRV